MEWKRIVLSLYEMRYSLHLIWFDGIAASRENLAPWEVSTKLGLYLASIPIQCNRRK